MYKILRLRSITYSVVVNLFIVCVFCRALFMCWPFDQNYNPRGVLEPLGRLSSYLGLDADLVLFSPNPPPRVDEVKFTVTFDDGTSENWQIPRDKMTPWDSEHSYPVYVRNAFLWSTRRSPLRARKYMARYVARQVATAAKHPVRVDFSVSHERIPPPEVGIGKPLVYGNRFETFFSYVIKPGDLN